MDDLRNEIWDYLFQVSDECSLSEIAAHFGCPLADVEAAVNHPWFRFANGKASVAYDVGSTT